MDQSIARYREAWAADSENTRAFEALEEHYFVSGAWDDLKSLYQRRLATPSLAEQPKKRSQLMFRLAQVIEERCLDADAAIELYWKVFELSPESRASLRQIRMIHTHRSQWDLVLQVAELESNTEMAPYERASLLVDLGHVWLVEVGDFEQAVNSFDEALKLNPQHQEALSGRARVLEAQGNAQGAAETLERLIGLMRGPERAPENLRLAQLFERTLHDPERAAECYRRALTDDPNNVDALEGLVAHAAAHSQWTLLADLYERRFDLTAGARKRAMIAVEASRIQLEQIDDPAAARSWLDRALELCGDDVDVHFGLAALERREGNDNALVASLDRIIELSDDGTPIGILIEAATLHAAAGRDERAVSLLNEALDRAPNDSRVLDALTQTLTRLGRAAELADILERRAALVDDPAGRSEILVELGRVYSEDLGDADSRRDTLARAFDAQPDAPGVAATLVGIYRKEENWERLRVVLDIAAAQGPSEERCDFRCELGDLFADQLDDVGLSRAAFESALELDGASPGALAGLERLAADSGDEDSLIRAWKREAEVCANPERKATLFENLVEKFEERDDDAEALAWLQKLLEIRPDDRALLESAARFQESLGEEETLIATLGQIDSQLSASEQLPNRLRVASLHARAGRDAEAARCYEKVLETDPRNLEALRALRVHYLGTRDWEPLAAVCGRLADLETGATRLSRLDELAGLLETQIGDPNGAIDVLLRLAEGSRDTSGEVPLDILMRLASMQRTEDRFEELADTLRLCSAALPTGDENAAQYDLERAQLMLESLERPLEAADLFRSVLARKPDLEAAAVGLEDAVRTSGDSQSLAALLEERSGSEKDSRRRSEMDFERASLLDTDLGRPLDAIGIYRALADDCDDLAARSVGERRLQELLERCNDWAALRERLEALLEAAGPSDADALHSRLAVLCRDRLGDEAACIRHFEALAASQPARGDVWRNLSQLYLELQPERAGDLLRVTRGELDSGPDAERRPTLLARAAQLSSEQDQGDDDAAQFYEELCSLEPGNTEASEFLIDRAALTGRADEVLRLLEARLLACGEIALDDDSHQDQRLSLMLRIATHLSDEMDRPEPAVEILEEALLEAGPISAVAEPLLALYESMDALAKRIDLSERANEFASGADEKVVWGLRLGKALCEQGRPEDLDGAVAAYRSVRAIAGEDREAADALCELYRRLDEAQPLAELLETELAAGRWSGTAARLELALLLHERLERPQDALAQFREILQQQPQNQVAFDTALQLAKTLQQSDTQLDLIEARLEGPALSDERSALLEMRGDLLAGPLDRPEDSLAAYREAAALRRDGATPLASLRAVLTRLERWPDLLEAIEGSARNASPAERTTLFEQAAQVASDHIGGDACLPWLERLRRESPEDATVPARIADLHRRTDRSGPLLRALDDQLALQPEPERELALQRERALLLEGPCEALGLASEALERIHQLDASEADVLARLDAIYLQLQRPADRLRILETCIAQEAPFAKAALIALHRKAAAVCRDGLDRSQGALEHLLRAIALCDGVDFGPEADDGNPKCELLRSLAELLRASDRLDAWARATETELAVIAGDSGQRERAADLHTQLAHCYGTELYRFDAAMDHLRALCAAGFPQETRDRAELQLLDGLRSARAHLELEARLTKRFERLGASAEDWLELARLRDEQLCALASASDAYRSALEEAVEPATRLTAIRGLRSAAERLADWGTVSEMLEAEIQHEAFEAPPQHGALLRKLGEVTWHRLSVVDEAAAAYERALEVQPEDLDSLHALQQLREQQRDWSAALDLLDREIELLGEAGDDADFSRQLDVALHASQLAREELGDPQRALCALELASKIAERVENVGTLPLEQLRIWAELYNEIGNVERFSEVFASCCDDPASTSSSADHLRLAEVLDELGRASDALERAQRSIEKDPGNVLGWDFVARLQEAGDDLEGATASLEQAAKCDKGSAGARRLCAASELSDASARRADLLRRAVDFDAASVRAHALLAAAEALEGQQEAAERAAGCAMDLAGWTTCEDLAEDLLLATTMIGGEAARATGSWERAARYYAAALEVEPQHGDALDAQCDVLVQLGNLEAAKQVLGTRLAQSGDNPRRAEQLGTAGQVHEQLGDSEQALRFFSEGLELDASLDSAHRGIVQIHEDAERFDLAVAALAIWCQRVPDSSAERYVHAAELELRCGKSESAERMVRAAVEADPRNDRGQVMLAQLLWDSARGKEALKAARLGLLQVENADSRAKLEVLCGQALEQKGDAIEAARAFGEAAANDPRSIESALAQARLLRSAGEWLPAATALGAFVAAYPESDDPALANVSYEWGRLLAGPLENTEEAIVRYERALELDSSLTRAREQLANLLTHLPTRWSDAVRYHGESLAERPTQASALRSIMRIARGCDSEPAVHTGLAVLRALGIASPDERNQAPACLPIEICVDPSMEQPVAEQARQLVLACSEELASALGETTEGDAPTTETTTSTSAFLLGVEDAEQRLLGNGLSKYSAVQLGDAIRSLLDVLQGKPDDSTGEGLHAKLEALLGRWARRKLRRFVEDGAAEAIGTLDFALWRGQVRELAAAIAVDKSGGDLRSALIALSNESGGANASAPGETDNLCAPIESSAIAQGVLGRAVIQWCSLVRSATD